MTYDHITGMSFNERESDDDRGTIVTFDYHPVHMKAASDAAGHPVYEDRLYVRIVQPANRNTEVFRAATEADKQRWPVRFRQFMEGHEQIGTGMPLEEWAILNKSTVMMLKGVGIKTVEQLAGTNDTNLGNIGMGARELRTKAQAYLEQAKTGAPLQEALAAVDNLRAEARVRDDTIKALQDQVKALTEKRNAE